MDVHTDADTDAEKRVFFIIYDCDCDCDCDYDCDCALDTVTAVLHIDIPFIPGCLHELRQV